MDDAEVLIRRPGYPERWTSATSRPILDAAKKPAGAVVVIRDVSERKRHEAELEAANASLRESEQWRRRSRRATGGRGFSQGFCSAYQGFC